MAEQASIVERFKRKLAKAMDEAVPELKNWEPSPAETTQVLGLDVEAAKRSLLESNVRP